MAIKSLFSVLHFSWSYTYKIIGKKLWLMLFYGIYVEVHTIIDAFFLKLILDNLVQIGSLPNQTIVMNISVILIIRFMLDAWDQFAFRHNMVLNRIMQRKLISRMAIDLSYKFASLPISVVENDKFRDQYTLVSNESGVRIYPLVVDTISLLSGLISTIIAAFIIIHFDWLYLLILFVFVLPRFIGLNSAIKKQVEAASLSARYSRIWDIYISFLQGSRGVYESRILNIKEFVQSSLFGLQDKTIGVFEKTEYSLLGQRTIGAIIPNIGVFIVGFLYLLKVIARAGTIGDWQLLTNTTLRISYNFKTLLDQSTNLAEGAVFVDKFINILNWPTEEIDGTVECQVKSIESIEFRNVTFRYPNMQKDSLKNLSFKVFGKENVAIVGHNGAGKTTLVKLLCRFYRPTEGQILLNGQDINEFTHNSYLQILSALFQEFETYGISATESIGYGDITRIKQLSKIADAAKTTGIHEYLKELPKGYKTPLIKELEDGVGLSTGQWQKIAIARSLFRDSQMIILDEPTSNLDPESEEEIFDDLIKTVKDKIMFLISHRFSTVRKADRILVINNGKLVEEGTHQSLMDKDGLYAKLFKIQSKSYQD